jgi:hypothetical protein
MWETPKRTWPDRNVPVVCVTADGDVVWLKRIDEGWMESDARGATRGNLQREPVAWIHPPRLPEVKLSR